MKKLVSIVLALLMVFALCSTALAQTEITYWYPHSGLDQDSLLRGAEAFMAKNPDIKVNSEFIGGSGSGSGITDKLTVAINGGTPPDAVLFDRFMVPQWADAGLFEDLTAYGEKFGVTKDRFFEFAWNEASYDGKLYAFPFDADTRALFYNKTLLAEAGFTEPPKTMDDLVTYARALNKKEGNRYSVVGFIPWVDQGSLLLWGWAMGGQLQDADGKITANDPAFVKAAEWLRDYAKEFDVDAITDFANATGSDIDPFSAGMFAMKVSGPWAVSTIRSQNPDLDFGVALIPTPTGTDNVSWAGGWSHVVPKGAANVEAGAQFIAFMTVDEGATFYGEDTTHFMSCKEINDELSWVKGDPVFELFVEIFPESYSRPPIAKGQLLWDELLTVQDKVIHDMGDPQQLLDEVTEKVNAEMGN